jgi:hypothetical protein
LRAPVRLYDSTNIRDDWRVDVTAADTMERFKEVIAVDGMVVEEDLPWLRPEGDEVAPKKDNSQVIEEMAKVMEAAYRRYLDPVEADREARMVGVPDDDDDSTPDFLEEEDINDDDSSDSMDDPEGDDESEENEEDDLDVSTLQNDMDLDVETLRGQLAESQVPISETRASSQTLRGDEPTEYSVYS